MKLSSIGYVVGLALATSAFAGGGSGQKEMKMMDTDQDGSISATEHAAGAKKMFEMMDTDHWQAARPRQGLCRLYGN